MNFILFKSSRAEKTNMQIYKEQIHGTKKNKKNKVLNAGNKSCFFINQRCCFFSFRAFVSNPTK